jgi:hypothetical protein
MHACPFSGAHVCRSSSTQKTMPPANDVVRDFLMCGIGCGWSLEVNDLVIYPVMITFVKGL